MEPVEVKLARIEEGMVALHGKVDQYHRAVAEKVNTMQPKVDNHEISIAVMKRDRWWMMMIAGVFGSAAATAVEKWMK